MKHVYPLLRLLGAVCSALILLRASTQDAHGATASPPGKLTYQGFLTDANGLPIGNAAPTNTSIIFRIYPSSSGAGGLIWSSVQTVTIDKGHFSVLLGEGTANGSEPFNADLSGVFTGATASDRYMEITVGGNTIAPRLQFLPAPYALLARSANQVVDSNGSAVISSSTMNISGTATATGLTVNGIATATTFSGSHTGSGSGLTSLNASQISVGTLPDARLSGAYTSALTLNNPANNFTGIGSGLTALNATSIGSGTLADARLSSNIPKIDSANTFKSGNTFSAAATFQNGATMGGDTTITRLHTGVTSVNGGGVFGNIMVSIKPASDRPIALSLRSINDGGFIDFDANSGMTLLSGNGFKPGGGSWGNASDARLKSNIVPMTGALERLIQLRGVTFDWIHPEAHAHQSNRQGGFIAQEVEKIFPEWVTPVRAPSEESTLTEDGMVKTISLPFEFDALLVESVKELNMKLKARDAELNELRAELAKVLNEKKSLAQTVSTLEAHEETRDARLARLEKALDKLTSPLQARVSSSAEINTLSK